MSSQPENLIALNIPMPDRKDLDPDMQKYFAKCDEKLGMVPNVLQAYAFDQNKLRNFANFYNEIMLGDSGLSKLEREMIGVVVSSHNHCYYCLVAHGQSVRQLSGDPVLGELMVMNYRVAKLSPRQRAMLDFAVKLTEHLDRVDEPDRQKLRDVGFSERDIWDIATVVGLFNLTNRVSSATGMMPNMEYHAKNR
ncbi:MAG: alkylhydroperoxidase [Burkholderiaceae bacterium]|jgi:uncharacterized peroxidase-related enzyme|nr:MAG: alkylhydroperoxidase [Burkholderiaceae bacterium]